jgi:Protein of unknown function (DUF3237)
MLCCACRGRDRITTGVLVTPTNTIPPPGLRHVADLSADVAAPIEIGTSTVGRRRVIPILGGRVVGPRLSGRVLPGANDYQIIRSDGVLELQARYIIETVDGALIYVENTGMREGPTEVLARQAAGEWVDPSLVYFRTVPRFETAAPSYQWLMRRIFLCAGARFPTEVRVAFYEVT